MTIKAEDGVKNSKSFEGRKIAKSFYLLGLGFFASLAIICMMTFSLLNKEKNYNRTMHLGMSLQQLAGTVAHYDEILTMSARLAALTGGLQWEDRYNRFVPKLDEAIAEISMMATTKELSDAIHMTDDANRSLIGGPGIPPEIREQIMQPFFTTKDVGKGTGLGLSISKGILIEHQGHLDIADDGANTCFVIDLPQFQAASSVAPSTLGEVA